MPTPAHNLFVVRLELVNLLRTHSDNLRAFMQKMEAQLKNPLIEYEQGELSKLYQAAKNEHLKILDAIEALLTEEQEPLEEKQNPLYLMRIR